MFLKTGILKLGFVDLLVKFPNLDNKLVLSCRIFILNQVTLIFYPILYSTPSSVFYTVLCTLYFTLYSAYLYFKMYGTLYLRQYSVRLYFTLYSVINTVLKALYVELYSAINTVLFTLLCTPYSTLSSLHCTSYSDSVYVTLYSLLDTEL